MGPINYLTLNIADHKLLLNQHKNHGFLPDVDEKEDAYSGLHILVVGFSSVIVNTVSELFLALFTLC